MRTKILLLGMFWAGIFANAHAKDTNYVVRQVLDNNIKKVVINDLAQVEITQGDSNCIFYHSKKKTKSLPRLCKVDKDKLTVYSLEEPNTYIKLVLSDDIEEFTLKTGAKVMVSDNFSMKNKTANLNMKSFANLKFDECFNTNILTLNMEGFATIEVDTLNTDSLIVITDGAATLIVNDGHIYNGLNTDNMYKTSKVRIYTKEQQYSVSSSSEKTLESLETLGNTVLERADKKRKGGYWDTKFSFGWSAYNWNDGYFATGNTPQNYQLNYGTAYILEVKARYNFPRNRFAIDMGIGYESDVMYFNDGVEYYKKDGVFDYITYEDTDAYGIAYSNVQTKLVARYVTLPLMFNLKFNDIYMGVGVVAGINYNNSRTGVKTTCLQTDINDNVTNETDTKMSYPYFYPYKMDFRATFGFKGVRLFFQTSMLSFSEKIDLYPYRIGMMLSL